MKGALSIGALWAWLEGMGYPLPTPGRPVLLYLDGCRPTGTGGAGGKRWKGSDADGGADLWEVASAVGSLLLETVENRPDAFNDTGILLWIADGQPRLAAFLGSVNAASRLSRKDGWPQLADGVHLYRRSTYKNGAAPCLRANRNRCLREMPPRYGVGGDGRMTLSEVIARGMATNGTILVHPGKEPWYSAGCLLTPGTATDPAWRAVHGHATDGCTVILHEGADFVAWLADGRPARPPVVRPGCNAERWVKPLQRALRVDVDGAYGPGTAKALRARREALGVTGAALEDVGVRSADWASLGIAVPVEG